MEFMNFLNENFVVVAVALYALGMFIRPIKSIPNSYIPFILLLASWGLGVAVIGFHPDVIAQGVIATAVAVLGDNFAKQGLKIKNQLKNK